MDNDSDEDSLDLDNDKGLAEALAEVRKESIAKKPLLVSVSQPFSNVVDGYTYSVVIFPKPGKVFYTKANHFNIMMKLALKKRKILNPN